MLGLGIQLSGYALIFAIFGATLYTIWMFILWLPGGFVKAKPEILISVLGGVGAVLLFVIERGYSKSRDIVEAHRPRKIETYEKFTAKISLFLQRSSKLNQQPDKQKALDEVVTAVEEFIRESILWASPDVLHAYSEFKVQINENPSEGLVLFDDLLRAIRKDLGHSNRNLKRGDLFKNFLKNPSEMDLHLSRAARK